MNDQRSFWTTLPGIITALAALVTAIGGLAGLLFRDGGGEAGADPTTTTSAPSPGASSSTTTSSTTGVRPVVPPTSTSSTTSSSTSSTSSTVAPGTTTTSTTAASSGLRGVETFLRADPFEHDGACPATIRFSGRVSVVGGQGTVSYRLLRSDGANAPVQTLSFSGPGSLAVGETWTRGEGSGWLQLEILDPYPVLSGQASFRITCS